MLNYRLNLEKCSSIFLMIDIDDPIVFLLLEDRIFLLSFQIDVPFLKDILDDRLKIGLLRKHEGARVCHKRQITHENLMFVNLVLVLVAKPYLHL